MRNKEAVKVVKCVYTATCTRAFAHTRMIIIIAINDDSGMIVMKYNQQLQNAINHEA